jgi:hypothetical protein
VAKRRRKKELSAVAMVKAMARDQLGAPPPQRMVPNRKKQKKEKHKPTLEKLLHTE